MACSVLVVVSALEELVDDPPLIRQVLRQLQLHTVSHARTRSKVYLVLSKIDKVVEEDVPVKILDRLLAGLLPAADGGASSAGLQPSYRVTMRLASFFSESALILHHCILV